MTCWVRSHKQSEQNQSRQQYKLLCLHNSAKTPSRQEPEERKKFQLCLEFSLLFANQSYGSDKQAQVIVLCAREFVVSNKLVSAKIEDEKLWWTLSDIVNDAGVKNPQLVTFINGNP